MRRSFLVRAVGGPQPGHVWGQHSCSYLPPESAASAGPQQEGSVCRGTLNHRSAILSRHCRSLHRQNRRYGRLRLMGANGHRGNAGALHERDLQWCECAQNMIWISNFCCIPRRRFWSSGTYGELHLLTPACRVLQFCLSCMHAMPVARVRPLRALNTMNVRFVILVSRFSQPHGCGGCYLVEDQRVMRLGRRFQISTC